MLPFCFQRSSWLTSIVLLCSLVPSWGSAKTLNQNAGKSLYTSSVTYCLPPDAIIVSSFDFTYYQANETGTFDLSAASVSSDINPEVTVSVEIYGEYPVNWTISVCDYLDGALCPLPTINFTGGSSIPIPDDITSLIPSIAWTVPDLEIYVTLLITDAYSGDSVACLQATLSNGWSTEQYAVLWASAVFVLLAIGVSWLHTCLNYCRVDDVILAKQESYSAAAISTGIVTGSSSPGQSRIVDIVYLFQTMTFVGMLGIDYPNVFAHFVLNFRWAVGLFYVGTVQKAINKARHLTGAKLTDVAYPSVLLVDRKSTYAQDIGGTTSSSPLLAAYALPSVRSLNESTLNDVVSRSLSESHTLLPRADVPASDTLNQSTALADGIPVYSNAINISSANTWMTVFFTWLMAIAVFLAIHLVAWGLLWLFVRSKEGKRTTDLPEEKEEVEFAENPRVISADTWWGKRLLANFHLVFLTNALRLNLMMFFPICVFTLWQFTLHDAWLPIFLAAIVLVWTLVFLLVAEGSLLVAARRSHSIATDARRRSLRIAPSHASSDVPSDTPSDAPSDATLTESVNRIEGFTGRLSMFSPFPLFRPAASGVYQQFRRPLRLFWLVPVVIPGFLKACFIAFGQRHGFLQLVALIVIEGLTFVASLVARPYTSKKGDWIGSLLALFRLIGTGLPLVFFDRLNAGGIVKTVIGIVCIAVWGIIIVILFIGVWFNLFWGILWKRHYPQAPIDDSDFVAVSHHELVARGAIDQSEKAPDMSTDRFIEDGMLEPRYIDESVHISEDRCTGESDSIRPFSQPEIVDEEKKPARHF